MDSGNLVRCAGGQGLPQRRYLDNPNDKRPPNSHYCHPAPRGLGNLAPRGRIARLDSALPYPTGGSDLSDTNDGIIAEQQQAAEDTWVREFLEGPRRTRWLALPPQVGDLVTEAGGVFEFKTARGIPHLLFEGGDEAGQLILGHLLEAGVLQEPGPPSLLARYGRGVAGGRANPHGT